MVIKRNICLTVLVVFLSIFSVEFLNSTKRKHPDAGLNIKQLVRKYKYPLEVHKVTTDDGYILTLHRIPHGRDKSREKGIPILFMHGFMQSATDFVNLGPGKALSLLLADEGYDIWLGNARGTTWSRNHTSLDPKKDWKFWDFSLHEIGLYDVPSFIDYILKITERKKLQYIGYSQGVTTFFILMSEKPQYVDKVTLMSALAPAIFLTNPQGPLLKVTVYFRKILEIVLIDILNVYDLVPNDGLIAIYLKQICDENSLFVNLCLHHIFTLHGYHSEGINKTALSLMFSNTPAGGSPRQMMHIIQLMGSDNFQQYDFGMADNLRRYGQRKPSVYNISHVSTPVALYYSSNDWTVNIQNMEKILKLLPNVVKNYKVPLAMFNHNDFIYANDVVNLLYNSVITEILKY